MNLVFIQMRIDHETHESLAGHLHQLTAQLTLSRHEESRGCTSWYPAMQMSIKHPQISATLQFA